MPRSKPDEQAIEKILWDMTGEQTVELITAHWDEDVVWFDMMPHPAFGLKAVKQNLGAQIDALTDIKLQILDLSVQATEEMGFAYSNQRLTGKGKNGGPDLNVKFRQTDCFVKKAGQWWLVHQHISVPFDPATGQGVLDAH